MSAEIADLLGVYLRYCAASALRYLAIAGPVYGVFYVWFRRRWMAHHIQQRLPGRDEVGYELLWSASTMACSGLTTVLLWEAVQRGWTPMYYDVAAYGWPWFVGSIVLGVVGYDAWFYWQHRLLHLPWWFRHVHWIHHRVTNPTPFANFALHPVEALMGAAYFFLLGALVPLHPLALAAVSMYVFGWGMIAHLGFELYPKGFTRHPVLGWLNTATFHNMHHERASGNYSSILNYWDRVMRTIHPGYLAAFDAIKARLEPAEA
ncbi:MAG TPA: sterol desaturase family protein [Candidatus Binatia bacterium]|nr:sterol desaturase family protein [Candidatus Binatia bacterium]